ncbi:MAG: DUF285 domain-containing protein, partial [Clostridia bacterium]|nr:DUF285 domain-containing protein [Clostridia bacterium]
LNTKNHDLNCRKLCYWDLDGSELVVSRHWHELASNEEEVGSFEYNEVFSAEGAPWYESHAQIATFSVVAESDEFDVAPTSTANWFYGLENLTGVDFNGLNTTSTTNMSGMFGGCSSLQTLELNLLDTSNVDNMDGIFSGCSALTSLDLSTFDTVRLRSMKSMFSGCNAMTSVNLSSFSISNATVDENVFSGCTALNEITTPIAMGSNQISLAVKADAQWWNGTQDIEVLTNADVNKTIHRHDAHSFGNKVPQKNASCTENGVKAHYVCNICEQKFLEKTDATPATAAALAIEASGHSGGNATCTEQAKCIVCGENYGNLAPHTPGTPRSEQIVPANCEKAGSYVEVISCTECTQEISREKRELPINPDAHFWDEEHRKLEKEATCSETGLWIYTCIFNVKHTQTISIPIDPSAHKYGEWTVKVEESCSTTGMREHVCEYCGEVERDVIPMDVNKHVYGEWIVGKPATCTQDGEMARACVYSVNHKADVDTIPATGHTFGANTVRQAATCTLPESTSGICVTCGEYVTIELAPALGHDMKHFEAKAPTCLEHGWEAYDACSRCDESTYHEIEKLAHTVVRDSAVEPTCTEDGKTYGEHCSVCGTVLVEPQVIEAFGHEFGEWIESEKGSFNDYTQKKRVCLHDATHVESKIEVGSFNSGWVIPIIIFVILIVGELAFITVYLIRKYKEKIIGKWQRMKK